MVNQSSLIHLALEVHICNSVTAYWYFDVLYIKFAFNSLTSEYHLDSAAFVLHFNALYY